MTVDSFFVGCWWLVVGRSENVCFSFCITEGADFNTGFHGWAFLFLFSQQKAKRLIFLLMLNRINGRTSE